MKRDRDAKFANRQRNNNQPYQERLTFNLNIPNNEHKMSHIQWRQRWEPLYYVGDKPLERSSQPLPYIPLPNICQDKKEIAHNHPPHFPVFNPVDRRTQMTRYNNERRQFDWAAEYLKHR
jgi:hypothetical protein